MSFLRQVLDACENEHLTLHERKLADLFLELRRRLSCYCNPLAIGRRILNLSPRLHENKLFDSLLAVMGAHRVGHDREKPRMEGTLALKLRRRTMYLDENVLKHVVSIRFPNPAPNEVGVNGRSVPGHEFREGGGIAVTVT